MVLPPPQPQEAEAEVEVPRAEEADPEAEVPRAEEADPEAEAAGAGAGAGDGKGKSKGKGQAKGKSKAKGKGKGQGEKKDRGNYSLPAAQEQEVLEWMAEEGEAVWRRGHKDYKRRMEIWAAKAAEIGTTGENLELWWKSIRDWYVKLSKKPPSGSEQPKPPTDREEYILKNCKFYQRQQERNKKTSPPLVPLARSETASSAPPQGEESEPPPLPSPPSPGQNLLDSDHLGILVVQDEGQHMQPLRVHGRYGRGT